MFSYEPVTNQYGEVRTDYVLDTLDARLARLALHLISTPLPPPRTPLPHNPPAHLPRRALPQTLVATALRSHRHLGPAQGRVAHCAQIPRLGMSDWKMRAQDRRCVLRQWWGGDQEDYGAEEETRGVSQGGGGRV